MTPRPDGCAERPNTALVHRDGQFGFAWRMYSGGEVQWSGTALASTPTTKWTCTGGTRDVQYGSSASTTLIADLDVCRVFCTAFGTAGCCLYLPTTNMFGCKYRKGGVITYQSTFAQGTVGLVSDVTDWSHMSSGTRTYDGSTGPVGVWTPTVGCHAELTP